MCHMSTGAKVNFDAAPPAAVLKVPFSTTLLVRDTCLCLHVQRAARALARRFDLALKPAGLTNGQFSLMMSLNRPQSTDQMPGIPPATMRSVAELLGIDRTTLTAAVKTLQRRGLVAVRVGPTDKRGRMLMLTAEGRRVLAAATPIWTREHAVLEGELGDAGRLREELIRLAQ
jgi:DNA-binding MarR family transcriptional regulator